MRFRSKLLLGLATMTSVAMVATTAAANAATPDPRTPAPTQASHSASVHVMPPAPGTVARKQTNSQVAAAVPLAWPCPAGGTINMNWNYVDGVLATTNASMVSDITCEQPEPNATMQYLAILANLYHNTDFATTGQNQTTCTYNGTTPCTHATGDGDYPCVGPECSGTWQMQIVWRMTLPSGWVWSTWSSNCTPLDSFTTLICDAWSGDIVVPPTG